MSVFDKPGIYLRNPRGGVEDVAGMYAAGFRWVALNVGDHDNSEWDLVRARAAAAGMIVMPWGRVTSVAGRYNLSLEAATAYLCRLGKQEYNNLVIVNAEKELDDNTPLRLAIEQETIGMDAALSTEPWLFASLANTPCVKRLVVQLQLFPQEEHVVSSDPRSCKSRAYTFGATKVHFMPGVHELQPNVFPPLQHTHSIYTADDCSSNYAVWGSTTGVPFNLSFLGPLYPIGHPKHVKGKRPWTIRALKVAMHRAGFTDFTAAIPDGSFGPRLEAALRDLQVFWGLKPSGNYGLATHKIICGLTWSNVGPGMALTEQAAAWMLIP